MVSFWLFARFRPPLALPYDDMYPTHIRIRMLVSNFSVVPSMTAALFGVDCPDKSARRRGCGTLGGKDSDQNNTG